MANLKYEKAPPQSELVFHKRSISGLRRTASDRDKGRPTDEEKGSLHHVYRNFTTCLEFSPCVLSYFVFYNHVFCVVFRKRPTPFTGPRTSTIRVCTICRCLNGRATKRRSPRTRRRKRPRKARRKGCATGENFTSVPSAPCLGRVTRFSLPNLGKFASDSEITKSGHSMHSVRPGITPTNRPWSGV